MRKLPPLTELRAFEAAARFRSFKAAATELGVTPTAVSHQIRLLEAYCGQTLFRRQPRPITLTWAGEQLFPVIRDGLENFADALNFARGGKDTEARLRVTTTNAFAARWLVPRLPKWRKAHARIKLEILSSDEVLNLKNGEADISIRYVRSIPAEGPAIELTRDSFHVVAAPRLVGKPRKLLKPAELLQFPLIEGGWRSNDAEAPTWARWEAFARKSYANVPDLSGRVSLNFREELHAIEAVVSGQGVAICSDVLVASELASGALIKLTDVTIPGCAFYIVHRAGAPKMTSIKAFVAWAIEAR